MPPAKPTAGSNRVRALLPLILCACAALLLLAWRFHATSAGAARITFDVRVESEPVFGGATTLNGISYQSGMPCGVGSRTLRVEVPNAEPFQTNLFVWYRGASLGVINLKHSKGTLSLDVSPSPNTVSIRGPRFQENVSNCERKSLEVPTGDYEVVSKFERFSVSRRATVSRNSTAPVSIKPSVAALELVAEPASADFELDSVRPEGISIKGRTPTTVTSLPTGKYELSIWRGDYRKKVPVTVDSTPTNHVAVVFEYAKVTFKSQPSGAGIRDDETNLGTTPATLSFAPGEYRVSIGKDGYFTTNLEFKVTGNQKREINVTLLNAAYAEAMERAQSSISKRTDYERGLQEVDKALAIEPNNSEAARLKVTLQAFIQIEKAKALARRGLYAEGLIAVASVLSQNTTNAEALQLKVDIEAAQKSAERERQEAVTARKNRPKENLERASKEFNAYDEFEPHAFTTAKAFPDVCKAITDSLSHWNIIRNQTLDSRTALIHARNVGLNYTQELLISIGQTDEAEVTVCFKLLEYTSTLFMGLGAGPREHNTPMVASRAWPDMQSAIAKRVEEHNHGIKRVLQNVAK